jgi:hypothetical protein
MQLLHYKSLASEHLLGNSIVNPTELCPLNSAEVVIFYGQEDPESSEKDINRTVLYCRSANSPDTKIALADTHAIPSEI